MRVGFLFLFLVFFAAAGMAQERVVVFAPSSMADVMGDLARAHDEQSGQKTVLSVAGTQQLARQLDAGAPANLFITADREWMDWSIERGLIAADRVFALAGNRLVLAVRNEVENWADVDGLLTKERFAMAEPDSVPAGRYAKQALQKRGIWEAAKSKAVFGDNVRITVRRLARGEISAALVYGTDVEIEPAVKTHYTFPENAHDPIVYWAAVVKNQKGGEAAAFVDFLKGPAAGALFAQSGFTPAAPGVEQ